MKDDKVSVMQMISEVLRHELMMNHWSLRSHMVKERSSRCQTLFFSDTLITV